MEQIFPRNICIKCPKRKCIKNLIKPLQICNRQLGDDWATSHFDTTFYMIKNGPKSICAKFLWYNIKMHFRKSYNRHTKYIRITMLFTNQMHRSLDVQCNDIVKFDSCSNTVYSFPCGLVVSIFRVPLVSGYLLSAFLSSPFFFFLLLWFAHSVGTLNCMCRKCLRAIVLIYRMRVTSNRIWLYCD